MPVPRAMNRNLPPAERELLAAELKVVNDCLATTARERAVYGPDIFELDDKFHRLPLFA
jgi:hypothetical protein